jgi:hypothetical protein
MNSFDSFIGKTGWLWNRMSEKMDVECKYLAPDHESCKAVLGGEGRATRELSCTSRKDLCCYLCEDRESCSISCEYLEKTPEEQEKKGPQWSLKTSPDGKEKVFICPMCGAPYNALIPSGVIQVKCNYCGANLVVPPHLGGTFQQCPNHPDTLAVSMCNDCGQSFCDRCLYVFGARDGTLYLCSKCYKERSGSAMVGYAIAGAIPVVILTLAILGLAAPDRINMSPNVAIAFVLMGSLLLLGLITGASYFKGKEPLSVHDAKAKERNVQDRTEKTP